MPEMKKTFVVVYEEVIRHYFRVEAETAEEAEKKFHENANRFAFSRGEVINTGIVEIEEDI